MNMQAIQIMILLLDSFIKLAPWRIVTETINRIGCGASENLAGSLAVIVAACAGLCALPTASIFGYLLLIGYSVARFHCTYNQRCLVQPYPVRILSRRDGVGRVLDARLHIATILATVETICWIEARKRRGMFHA